MKRILLMFAVVLSLVVVSEASACPLGRAFGVVRGGAAKAKSGIGRTRFFDGDGRPLRRAR